MIIRIVNRKGAVIPQQFDVPAKDTDTHRMECGDPYALCPKPYQFIHTFPHLPCCLIGECDRQDIPGIDIAFINQVADPVRDHTGLSASRPGQDQDRSLCLKAGFLLLFI